MKHVFKPWFRRKRERKEKRAIERNKSSEFMKSCGWNETGGRKSGWKSMNNKIANENVGKQRECVCVCERE